MNLFTFAIASIVDANTGYGLAGGKNFVATDAAERHRRAIRSKSLHAAFASLRGKLAATIENYRARAQERRELHQLLAMNDRLLSDIGLSRGDLIAVELGTLTLQQLQQQRRGGQDDAAVSLDAAPTTAVVDVVGEAVNEQAYADKKCA